MYEKTQALSQAHLLLDVGIQRRRNLQRIVVKKRTVNAVDTYMYVQEIRTFKDVSASCRSLNTLLRIDTRSNSSFINHSKAEIALGFKK